MCFKCAASPAVRVPDRQHVCRCMLGVPCPPCSRSCNMLCYVITLSLVTFHLSLLNTTVYAGLQVEDDPTDGIMVCC
jgi:hypothetical protein